LSRFGSADASIALALTAIVCAATMAGCARHPDKQVAAVAPARSESGACRSVNELLEPQPAPDCEYRGSDLKTVDPGEFARLKLDFERQCYRRAEKLARDRLRLLQASRNCETRPGRHSAAVMQ
jgi:hypothetical protein